MASCVGTMLMFLQTSLVTTVIAPVGQALGASTAQLQWLNDAYALPLACLLLSAGTVADLWGHRRVFTLGAAVWPWAAWARSGPGRSGC